MPSPSPPRPWLRRLVLACLYASCAGLVVQVFVGGRGINFNHRAGFEAMIDGTAHRPFVHRTLIPHAVNAGASLISSLAAATGLADSHAWTTPGNLVWGVASPTGVPVERSLEFAVFYALAVGCYLGFALALRALVLQVYAFPPAVADTGPALALMLVPPLLFRYGSYVYDPATLFLSALGLWLVLDRRHTLFYLLLPVAMANRETAALLVGLFVLVELGRIPRLQLVLHSASQLAIALAVRQAIVWLYRDNPGSTVELHLLDHNLRLLHAAPGELLKVVVVVPVVVLVSHGWRHKPRLLRLGLAVTGLPLLAAGLVWGVLDELRIYTELYPLLVLLAVPTACTALGIGTSASEDADV